MYSYVVRVSYSCKYMYMYVNQFKIELLQFENVNLSDSIF